MIRSFTILLIILSALLCEIEQAAANVLARGDGFVIESSDIDAQKAYFSEKGFESTDVEHLNSVVKIRLFALEAKDSGLVSNLPEAKGPFKNETQQAYYRLFLAYYQHLLETYPVSEDALQSYYLSYPEKFRMAKDGDQDSGQKPDMWTLDDGIKSWIRSQIVTSQKAVIVENEFERLKKKYHVVYE